MWKPAGVCIHELATTIQIALKCAPRQTMQVAKKCTLRLDLVPAEQQHRQETRFEEEREDALRRQRAAEHVAHVARVGRPVRAELELHHDARRHADGEGQREDPRPEPRHLVVERVAAS